KSCGCAGRCSTSSTSFWIETQGVGVPSSVGCPGTCGLITVKPPAGVYQLVSPLFSAVARSAVIYLLLWASFQTRAGAERHYLPVRQVQVPVSVPSTAAIWGAVFDPERPELAEIDHTVFFQSIPDRPDDLPEQFLRLQLGEARLHGG